jgi:Rrf2 family protein
MVALAQRYGAGVTLMKDVAREEGISEKYLGQIIMPLKSAGLVVSQRGTHGGYSLARPSAEITVRDVIVAIEGPIAPAPCTDRAAGRGKGGATCGCPYPPVCAVSRADYVI